MQQAELGLNLSTKRTRTRKREFLVQMERVVPWTLLEALIAPHAPKGRRGRRTAFGAHDVAHPLHVIF